MKVEIMTADGVLFEGNADEVLLPGVGGGLGIKKGHAPLVVALHLGGVIVVAGEKRQTIAILGGTASVSPAGVTVFASL